MSDQDIINAALEKLRGKINVVPKMGILPPGNLTNLDNWRAFIHQITPVVVTTLVGMHIFDNNVALLWVPLLFAILDPILSYANTTDKIRKIVYAVVGLAQSGTLATSIAGILPEQLSIVGGLLTIGSSFLARFFTPTTTFTLVAK